MKNIFFVKIIMASREQLIKEYIEICKKCDITHIYDVNQGKCVARDSILGKELSKEIAFCDKYYKPEKGDAEEILNNILNIKVPKGMVDNAKEFKIKDFIGSLEMPGRTDPLSKKINIKDPRYSVYINYIPALAFGLFQIMSSNPEIYRFIKDKTVQIINQANKNKMNVFSYMFNVLIKMMNSKYIISVVSLLPFTTFVKYITQFFSVITNIPKGKVNTNVTSRMAEAGVYSKTTNFVDQKDILSEDNFKEVELDEDEVDYLQKNMKNSYNKISKTVNLKTLGVNVTEIANPKTKINIGYDDTRSRMYIKVTPSTFESRNVFGSASQTTKTIDIYEPRERATKLKTYTAAIRDHIKKLENEKQRIDDMRENQRKFRTISNLEKQSSNIEDVLDEMNINNKTNTTQYRDLTKQKQSIYKELRQKKNTIDLDSVPKMKEDELKQVSVVYQRITAEIKNLKELRKFLDDGVITIKNLNYYTQRIEFRLSQVDNFLKELQKKKEADISGVITFAVEKDTAIKTSIPIPEKNTQPVIFPVKKQAQQLQPTIPPKRNDDIDYNVIDDMLDEFMSK